MARFVKRWHPFSWTSDRLDSCYLIEVTKGKALAGLVWGCWFPGCDRVLDIHVCAAPKHRGRWVNRRTLDALFSIGPRTGARTLVSQVTSPQVERIWRSLGFNIIAGLAVKAIEEPDNGKIPGVQPAEGTQARAAA